MIEPDDERDDEWPDDADSEAGTLSDTEAQGDADEFPQCSSCGCELIDVFYVYQAEPLCPECEAGLRAMLAGGSGLGRFAKAALLGTIASIGGAALYATLHHPMVLILVGLLIGGGVRLGSGGRGGLLYQVLAALLVYAGLSGAYIPKIVEAIRRAEMRVAGPAEARRIAEKLEGESSLETLRAIAAEVARRPVWIARVALSLPVGVARRGHPIFLLLIAFAMWEGWKVNNRLSGNSPSP